LKSAAWLCCIAISELDKRTTLDIELAQSSKLVKDIVRILLDAHRCLIELVPQNDANINETRTIQAKRCKNLISLIRSLLNREQNSVLALQEKIAQKLVYSDPLDSFNLILLAFSKVELYDLLVENSASKNSDYLTELLEDAKKLLLTCNEYLNDGSNDKLSNKITGKCFYFQNISIFSSIIFNLFFRTKLVEKSN
jgi:hypothetical protein